MQEVKKVKKAYMKEQSFTQNTFTSKIITLYEYI